MLTWEEVVPVVVLVVVIVEVYVLVVEEALVVEVVVAFIVGMLSFTSYKKGNSHHYRG